MENDLKIDVVFNSKYVLHKDWGVGVLRFMWEDKVKGRCSRKHNKQMILIKKNLNCLFVGHMFYVQNHCPNPNNICLEQLILSIKVFYSRWPKLSIYALHDQP